MYLLELPLPLSISAIQYQIHYFQIRYNNLITTNHTNATNMQPLIPLLLVLSSVVAAKKCAGGYLSCGENNTNGDAGHRCASECLNFWLGCLCPSGYYADTCIDYYRYKDRYKCFPWGMLLKPDSDNISHDTDISSQLCYSRVRKGDGEVEDEVMMKKPRREGAEPHTCLHRHITSALHRIIPIHVSSSPFSNWTMNLCQLRDNTEGTTNLQLVFLLGLSLVGFPRYPVAKVRLAWLDALIA